MIELIAMTVAFILGGLIASNIVDCIKTDDIIDTSVKTICAVCLVIFGFMFLSRFMNPVLPCDCEDSLEEDIKEYIIEIKNDSIIKIYKYEYE